ncbi:MAG: thiamine-phosphate kinase [Spirochaetia bacterium]|nr:thiamine-phosphate kinase [Spirochaetia bacterium]
MNERSIIDLFYKNSSLNPWQDDCALIENDLLITTDSMIENTHFKTEWSTPEDLAFKLFHSNLSDLSASGGNAMYCLLNAGFPSNTDSSFISRFSSALSSETGRYSCRIIGGDTFRSETIHLTLTMLGKIKTRHLKRSDGKSDDALYITGYPGLSYLGYKILSEKINTEDKLKKAALERHLRPCSRSEWSLLLSDEEGVHAAMDLSDGILTDSEKLAKASGIGLFIDIEKIPIFKGITDHLSIDDVISGGEDYEILFLGKSGLIFPFPAFEIGYAVRDSECRVTFIKNQQEVRIQNSSFYHFNTI